MPRSKRYKAYVVEKVLTTVRDRSRVGYWFTYTDVILWLHETNIKQVPEKVTISRILMRSGSYEDSYRSVVSSGGKKKLRHFRRMR